QIAQSVSAGQSSQALSSYFLVQATPRPGHTVEELHRVIDEEIAKLQNEPPSEHELDRSLNQIEASFYNRMERVGGFGGKGDRVTNMMRLRLTFLALGLAASVALSAQQAPDRAHPPQPGPPPALHLPAIQKQQLSNGLPVWMVELHEVPVAQINLLVFSGTA